MNLLFFIGESEQIFYAKLTDVMIDMKMHNRQFSTEATVTYTLQLIHAMFILKFDPDEIINGNMQSDDFRRIIRY